MGFHKDRFRTDFMFGDILAVQCSESDTLLEFGLDALVRVLCWQNRDLFAVAQATKVMQHLATPIFNVTKSSDALIGFFADSTDSASKLRDGSLDFRTAMIAAKELFAIEMVPPTSVRALETYVDDNGEREHPNVYRTAVVHCRLRNVTGNPHIRQEWFPGPNLRVGDF